MSKVRKTIACPSIHSNKMKHYLTPNSNFIFQQSSIFFHQRIKL